MDLGNGWTTEKLRDEILEHIWIDETGDMGGVHCMHCLGYEQGEIDRAINTVFAAALQRAKAEVLEDNARLRGAVQECVRCIEVLSMKGVDHDEVHTVDAAIREGWWCSMAIDARTHALVAIQLSKDLDACAAQIEEGSDYGINR